MNGLFSLVGVFFNANLPLLESIGNTYFWDMRARFQSLLKNDFFRNVATLMTGSSIAQLVALAIYPILTDIYTKEEHGVFALYMSIIAISGIVSTGRYQMAILMPKDDKKAVNIVGLGLLLSLVVSAVLLIVVLLFGHNLAMLFRMPAIEKWLIFIPLSTLMIGVFEVSIQWHNRQKKFKSTASANLIQSLSNSGVKVSTSKLFSPGGGLIAGAIIGQLAGGMFFIFSWIIKFRLWFSKLSWREMRIVAKEYYRFPAFNMPNNLINNISNSLPVFLLSIYFGAAEVGLYGLAFAMVFRPMSLVVNSMEQVFSQRVISKFNAGSSIRKDFRTLMIRSVQIGIVPFVLAGIFGPIIFKSIFGPEWEESGRYMQILLPWFFTAFLANQLTFLPDMLSRQKGAFVLNIVRLILRVIGMAIGISQNDIYLTLALFSGLSMVMVLITLGWYVQLIRQFGNGRTSNV